MTIIYGGTKKQVKMQLKCSHVWEGPAIDAISRYLKCRICFCLDRDCSKEEYYEAIRRMEYDRA